MKRLLPFKAFNRCPPMMLHPVFHAGLPGFNVLVSLACKLSHYVGIGIPFRFLSTGNLQRRFQISQSGVNTFTREAECALLMML